jgi:periplasmic divalent cation tolerance protein
MTCITIVTLSAAKGLNTSVPAKSFILINPKSFRRQHMTEFIQVSTTTDKREEAERISQKIVEKRLAACVQIIGPVTSCYQWKEKLEKAEEWLLIMKTQNDLYPRLEEAIKKMHSYEVPEIVAVQVSDGSKEYLGWIKNETGC